MAFVLPEYHPPDFSLPQFTKAPIVTFRKVTQKGVAPEGFHATSIFPEYLHLTKRAAWSWCANRGWTVPSSSKAAAISP